MNLKTHCLGRTPLGEVEVQEICDMRFTVPKEHLQSLVYKLAMSHERLRAETVGLQIMYDQLDRKVRHGCTDHPCKECDSI